MDLWPTHTSVHTCARKAIPNGLSDLASSLGHSFICSLCCKPSFGTHPPRVQGGGRAIINLIFFLVCSWKPGLLVHISRGQQMLCLLIKGCCSETPSGFSSSGEIFQENHSVCIHLCDWNADCSPRIKCHFSDTTCLSLDDSVLQFLCTPSSPCYAAVACETQNVRGLAWQGSGSVHAGLE